MTHILNTTFPLQYQALLITNKLLLPGDPLFAYKMYVVKFPMITMRPFALKLLWQTQQESHNAF